MDDPAKKLPIDPEEASRLASGAGTRFGSVRNPGPIGLTIKEMFVISVIILVVFGAFFIHLDVAPFLPFTISPGVADWLTPLAVSLTFIAAIMIVIIAVVAVLNLLRLSVTKIYNRKPYVKCHPCGARITTAKYEEIQHCPKCNSNRIYCAKCGRASAFDAFVKGDGCEYCEHPYAALDY